MPIFGSLADAFRRKTLAPSDPASRSGVSASAIEADPTPRATPLGSPPPLTDPGDPNKLMDLSSRAGAALPDAPQNQSLYYPGASPAARALARGTPVPEASQPKTQTSPINDYRGNPIQDMEDFRRDQYVRKGGAVDEDGKFHAKRSFKDILLNGVIGFAQGMGTGGGLGAGLGGAVAGAAGSAISPTMGRERLFDAFQRPSIAAGVAKREKADQQKRQVEMDELRRRESAARVGQIEAETAAYPDKIAAEKTLREKQMAAADLALENAKNPKQPRRMVQGTNRKTGQMTYYDANDPVQNAEHEPFVRQSAERQPTLADEMAGLADEEGTVPSIAESSYQGRGGDAYVKSKLPAPQQQILDKRTVTEMVDKLDPETGKPLIDDKGLKVQVQRERPATNAEIVQAQEALNKAIAAARKTDLEYTGAEAKKKASLRRGGRTPSTTRTPSSNSGASGPKAKLSDLTRFLK
jgi:hypothetical protein